MLCKNAIGAGNGRKEGRLRKDGLASFACKSGDGGVSDMRRVFPLGYDKTNRADVAWDKGGGGHSRLYLRRGIQEITV